MFTAKDTQYFIDTFRDYPTDEVVQIKINGKIVRLSSGKSAWTTMGAAKGALTSHLYGFRRRVLALYLKVGTSSADLDYDDIYRQFIQKMLNEGVLEFVVTKV